MKKIVFTLALVAFAFAANAQYVIGGQIGFNTNGGKHWASNTTGTTTTEYTLPNDVNSMFVLAPKFGYNINEKMHVGIVLGFASETEKDYSNYRTLYSTAKELEGWYKTTQNHFYVAPYFRYTCMQFDKFSVFVEAQLAYGFSPKAKYRSYNTAIAGVVDANDNSTTGNITSSEFAFAVAPGVNYRFSNHFSADLYIDLLGLSFSSTTSHYYESNNGVTNEWKRTSNDFSCIATLGAETLRDHLSLFRLGFNYHF